MEQNWQHTADGWSHWKLTNDDVVSISVAMQLQKEYDPESVNEFNMLSSLQEKQIKIYSDYMDS